MTSVLSRHAAAALFVAGLMSAVTTQAVAQGRESVERVASRPGVTQGYFLIEPEDKPRAIAIVFVGGDGETALTDKGPTKLTGNFLMRVRAPLSAAGLILAYPDAPSDRVGRGLGDFRTGENHAQDIGAVVKQLTARHGLPVFLIGTSRGTISAANVAARLDRGTIAGVVLTSTVTERSKNRQRSAMDTPLDRITAPVFVMSHKDDTCYVTPPSAIPGLLRAMTNAPRKDSLLLSGGDPARSDPCEALSEHGFLGIYKEASAAMTNWIDSVLAGK